MLRGMDSNVCMSVGNAMVALMLLVSVVGFLVSVMDLI